MSEFRAATRSSCALGTASDASEPGSLSEHKDGSAALLWGFTDIKVPNGVL